MGSSGTSVTYRFITADQEARHITGHDMTVANLHREGIRRIVKEYASYYQRCSGTIERMGTGYVIPVV